MSIVFKNDGLIDLTAVKTFGVSSKEGDSPIGYFGTGLKYAIAIMLRNNIKFAIYRGRKRITFSVKKKRVRKDNFNIICMNDVELGFTTDVGKNWEMWQAFRELYCNCTDEGGEIFEASNVKGEPATTTIVVEGAEFQNLFNDRGKIVLSSEPTVKTDGLGIHHGSSSHLFYRGIRVSEESKVMMFTYNITKPITLTEDRTVKFPWSVTSLIRDEIIKVDCEDALFRILQAPEGSYEAGLDFTGASGTISQAFLNVASSLERSNGVNVNKSAITLLRNHQRRSGEGYSAKELNHIEHEQLERAKKFCRKMGYNIDEFPIFVVDDMDADVLGLAENGKILIAHRCFDLGTKFVAHAVLEEYIHLKEGFHDCTRDLQSYLFKKLISMGEKHVLGEAL